MHSREATDSGCALQTDDNTVENAIVGAGIVGAHVATW